MCQPVEITFTFKYRVIGSKLPDGSIEYHSIGPEGSKYYLGVVKVDERGTRAVRRDDQLIADPYTHMSGDSLARWFLGETPALPVWVRYHELNRDESDESDN